MSTEATNYGDTHTFYGTFGSGQVGYPGHVRIPITREVGETDNDMADRARKRMVASEGQKWAFIYDSWDKVHEGDRCYRGNA